MEHVVSYDYNAQPAQPNPAQPNPYSGQYDPNAGKSDKRVFGLWGLWLGISSLVIGPFLFGLVSLAGIVMSIVALAREPRSKAMGIWGIVLSAVGFIWMIIFWTLGTFLLAWIFVGSVGDTFPSYTPHPSYTP